MAHFDRRINLKNYSIKYWKNMSNLNNGFDFEKIIYAYLITNISKYKRLEH
jgi:hypothetical protein